MRVKGYCSISSTRYFVPDNSYQIEKSICFRPFPPGCEGFCGCTPSSFWLLFIKLSSISPLTSVLTDIVPSSVNSFCILSWIFNCSYNSVCFQRLSNMEAYDRTSDLLLEYTDKTTAAYESSFASSFVSTIIHSLLSTNTIVILLFKLSW